MRWLCVKKESVGLQQWSWFAQSSEDDAIGLKLGGHCFYPIMYFLFIIIVYYNYWGSNLDLSSCGFFDNVFTIHVSEWWQWCLPMVQFSTLHPVSWTTSHVSGACRYICLSCINKQACGSLYIKRERARMCSVREPSPWTQAWLVQGWACLQGELCTCPSKHQWSTSGCSECANE